MLPSLSFTQFDFTLVVQLQYLGIPLLAGVVTRLTLLRISPHFFHHSFLPYFSPVALLGLLYTILVLFAYQGHHIIHDIGKVARVAVPLILYFMIMWIGAAALLWTLVRRELLQKCARGDRRDDAERTFDYETTVVQAFTAGSNNFVRLSLKRFPSMI